MTPLSPPTSMTAGADTPTPITDAAWAECVRQGGKYEPFHGPLVDCSKQLEHSLAACREVMRELLEVVETDYNDLAPVAFAEFETHYDDVIKKARQALAQSAKKDVKS